MLTTAEGFTSFIQQFEACRLPRSRWTHSAHLAVGLWYLRQHRPDNALPIVRRRIQAYNVFVGTANTDSGGYHETLTRCFLQGIAAYLHAHLSASLPASLVLLLQSPLGDRDWPLAFYSRE